MRAHLIGASALAVTIGAAGGAAAQSSQPIEIEEIIVTAQKRAENLQDVPITITAFNGAALEKAGVGGVEQLAGLTPGLYIGKFSALRPQVYMRGVGSRVFDPGSEGSIGIFTDEGYMGRMSGSLSSLLDVERVEVLKGPQGTLYGRNTIGGAINITTRAPTRDFEGYAEGSLGNFDSVDFKAAISGPLSERFAGRLAVGRTYREGYTRDRISGARGNGDDSWTVRGRLRGDLSDHVTWNLTLEHQNTDAPGLQQHSTGVRQFLQAASSPSVPVEPDPYVGAYNVDGYTRRELSSLLNRIDWETGAFDITALTSLRGSLSSELYDLDSTPLKIWTYAFKEKSKQFSQELRFSSTPGGVLSLGGKGQWVIGAYYYRERTKRYDVFDLGADSIFHTGQAGVERNIYDVDIDTDSVAIFGQYTFHLTDALSVTAGGRYTRDKKDAVISATSNSTTPPAYYPGFTITPGKTWTSTDPKVTIDYKPIDGVMLYATVSRGFKSGGFQFNATNAALANQVFDPERVWTYEIGVKSQFWDNRAQLNVSAFQYDYKNLQLPRFTLLPPPAVAGSGTNIISNAAASTIKGVDISGVLALTRDLKLTAGLSLLDATYDEYVSGASNFSGNRMIRSPKAQGNIEASYEHEVAEGLSIRAGADWSYTSRINFEADEGARPFTTQGGYGLLNYRVGLGATDEGWSVDGWVRNAGDKRYVSNIFAVPVTVLQNWAMPRSYGLTARYRF